MRFLVTLVISFCLLCLSGCHIGRFAIWNLAGTNDYQKFPAHPIQASKTPFQFSYAPDSIQQKMGAAQITVKGKQYPLTGYLGEAVGKSLAFLVIRRDTILFESYYRGYEAAEPPIPSFSVAKSFVSALVGVAVQEGHIASVNDPITRYLPELKERDPRFARLTIAHLLDMRSGLKFNENSYINPFAPIAKFYYGRQLEKYTLMQSVFEEEPNASREYQSINTQLLAMAVERATGRLLPEYLEAKIWRPLGMEFPASWSASSRADSTTKAFCCLNAQARDFAKFGRLYLHQGRWEGKQVLDSAWIARSIRPNYENGCYQYQWYSTTRWESRSDSLSAVADAPAGSQIYPYEGEYAYRECGPGFLAIGILGQYIYVDPEKDLIMVRMGKEDKVDYQSLFEALGANL
ncbi:MAG: serine hydrolase [Bacteroidota bacterium]